MAVGDDATLAGLPLVPNTGEEGRVRWGARELNRTRDFVAQTRFLIPSSASGFRDAADISSGTADPNNNDGKPDGTIYLKIVG